MYTQTLETLSIQEQQASIAANTLMAELDTYRLDLIETPLFPGRHQL